ncbi:hypothetical protein H0E87_022737 [Populus deltoides]|uniref:Uncharacterized protein n=1 Tax=Populus deltoides TaxID=3696 RepID=A0A8T2XAU3_POPDE|nr:hypothetical protein H0E87_022737 [Populus deltoides]
MDSPAIRPGIVEPYGAWVLVQKSRPSGKKFDPLIKTKSVKVTTTVKQPYGDSDSTQKAMRSRYDILTEFQVPDQIEIPESSAAREISGNDFDSLILGLIKHSIPARLHDPTDSVDYVDMVSA